MTINNTRLWFGILVLSLATLLPGLAQAGQPLICRDFAAGNAPLLPWGTGGWNTPGSAYDVRRLVADTLRLLSPDAPILARMENLRRATLYARRDRAVADELRAALLGRTASAAAAGSKDPLPWFDAGYLIESYEQAGLGHKPERLAPREKASSVLTAKPDDVDGYALVRKAMELGGSTPEMEFAASLMDAGANRAEHRRRAATGARPGSLLAKNLTGQ